MALVYTKNLVCSDVAAGIFNLKALLKSVGWTVTGSGEGAGGANFSTTADIITQASTGVGGMANVNAWFRIAMPAGGRTFIFKNITAIGTWVIKYAYTGGFTGVVDGAISATVAPTATTPAEEQLLVGASSTTGWSIGATGAWRYNMAADNAAPYGFYWTGAAQGVTGVNGNTCGIVLDPMLSGSYDASDVDPYVFYFCNKGSNSALVTGEPFGYLTNGMATESKNFAGQSYIRKGYADSIFTWMTAAKQMAISSLDIIPNGLMPSPYTSKDPVAPIVWMHRFVTSGLSCVKGVSTMMKWNGVYRNTWDTLSLLGSKDRIVGGSVNLPWDGSTPIV